MKKTVSATEARVHFGELFRSVAEDGATYIVERAGRPQAVLVSAAEYERLENSRPSRNMLTIMHEARREFQTLIESGAFDDIEDVIRSEREQRDEQLHGP